MFDLLALLVELRVKIYQYVVHDLFDSWNALTTESHLSLALSCKQLYFEAESEWCKALDKIIGARKQNSLLQHVPITTFKQGVHLQFFRSCLFGDGQPSSFYERLRRRLKTDRVLRRLIHEFGSFTIRSDPDLLDHDGTLRGLLKSPHFLHLEKFRSSVEIYSDATTKFNYWTPALYCTYTRYRPGAGDPKCQVMA